MREKEKIVEVMARATFEAEGRAKDVRWEDADKVLFLAPDNWRSKPVSVTEYFRMVTRVALAALEAEGYVVVPKPVIPAFLAKSPGIPHKQDPYVGEKD